MERVGMRLHPKMPPLPQILAVAPNMPSWRLAAIVVFMTSSGWPSVVTSNMFSPAPSRRLLNLTGFFSICAFGAGDETTGTLAMVCGGV